MTTTQPIGLPAGLFGLPLEERLQQLLQCGGVGLQSTIFAEARAIIRAKILQKLEEQQQSNSNGPSSSTAAPTDAGNGQKKVRRHTSIVVAYTSNLISCGLRETFASMAKLKAADAFVSTAGGVEEDIIKCLGDTIVGDFALKGADLRLQGLNRVGNLIIPNDNYIDFETFFVPVIKQLHQMQLMSDWAEGTSPADLIRLVGQTLDKPSSDAYLQLGAVSDAERAAIRAEEEGKQKAAVEDLDKSVEARVNALALEKTRAQSLVCCCARSDIPIYCPALTDGSMGDMICFYSFNKKGFVCDPCVDYKCLVDIEAISNTAAGDEEIEHDILVLALGAGLPRNHALHLTPATGTYVTDAGRTIPVKRTVVQIVTGLDIDGCNSGAQLADDLQEGLVNKEDTVIRVHGDAALLLPMMVGGLLQ